MPKVVDHDARRAAIGQAFFRVIARSGIEGATMREIAREAGVSLGVLSHYFADKEALVAGAFDVLVAQFTHRLAVAAQTEASIAGALEAVCLATLPFDDTRRRESGVWMSFWAHGYASAAARTRQREAYAVWVGTLARLIAHLPGMAGRDEAAAREAAGDLAALIDGLTIQLILRGPEDFTPAAAAAAVRRRLGMLA